MFNQLPDFLSRELDFVRSLWLGAVVVPLRFTGSHLNSISRKTLISMFCVYKLHVYGLLGKAGIFSVVLQASLVRGRSCLIEQTASLMQPVLNHELVRDHFG